MDVINLRKACFETVDFSRLQAEIKNPDLYNLTLKPTAESFETDNVEMPKEGEIPIPGKKA